MKYLFVSDCRHPITSRLSFVREVVRGVLASPYLPPLQRQEDALRTKSDQHHPLAIKHSLVSILFLIEILSFKLHLLQPKYKLYVNGNRFLSYSLILEIKFLSRLEGLCIVIVSGRRIHYFSIDYLKFIQQSAKWLIIITLEGKVKGKFVCT